MSVAKVHSPTTVAHKQKQDVNVVDSSESAAVTLWGSDINSLKANKSYQLNRLKVRSYLGKKYFSFPSSVSKDDIDYLEDNVDYITSSDEKELTLTRAKAVGVRDFEAVYRCSGCKRNGSVTKKTAKTAVCDACTTVQRLPKAKYTRRLVLESKEKNIILKASDQIRSDTVTEKGILYAPPFDVSYNK